MKTKIYVWIFAVLLLSSFTFAVTEQSPIALGNYALGPTTKTGNTFLITGETKYLTDAYCYIRSGTTYASSIMLEQYGTLLYNATVNTSGGATFPSVQLTLGETYNISCYRGGQQYSYAYGLGSAFPYTGTGISWTRSFDGTTSDTAAVRSIGNITYIVLGVQPTYTIIKMYNPFDNSSINTFNVTLGNSSNHYIANTTNGSITFTNLTNIFQMNITVPGFYESFKTVNFNATGRTYTNTSIQAIFNVTAYEIITGTQLSGFNASLTYNNQTTGNSLYLITNNATQTVIGQKAGYRNTSLIATATTGTITPVSLNFSTSLLSITVLDGVSSGVINNVSVILSSLNYTYTVNASNVTGNKINFDLLQSGTYNILVNASNYAYLYYNVTIGNEVWYNYTAYLFQTNSFFIVFKDEITKSIIPNISLQLISDVFANNYTTSNGTLNVLLLTPSDYTFRYQSNGNNPSYPQREYYQTLVNRQSYNLTLYLIDNVSSTLITTIVYNQNNDVVQDATVKVLRYDITSNSYILVAEKITDANGESIFYLQPYGEYYKFIIEYNGLQYFESTASQITSNSYTFQIILNSIFGTQNFNAQQTVTNLSVVSGNTFRFYWNDANNEITQGCMYVYANITQIISSQCSTGSAGVILYTIPSINSTYRATAFVYQGDEYNYVDTKWITFTTTLEDIVNSDMLFYLFLITLVCLFIFALNAVLAMVILPIPMLLFNIFGFISFDNWYVMAITIPCWIIAYIIEMKQ